MEQRKEDSSKLRVGPPHFISQLTRIRAHKAVTRKASACNQRNLVAAGVCGTPKRPFNAHLVALALALALELDRVEAPRALRKARKLRRHLFVKSDMNAHKYAWHRRRQGSTEAATDG